jgi:hypothetical protein
MVIMRSRYEGSFSPAPSRTSKFIPGDRRDFYLAGRGMRTYLQSKSNFVYHKQTSALTHPTNGLMLEELRRRLVDLYADLAAHTKPECTSRCKRSFSCCEKRHCIFAIESRATTGAWSFSQPDIESSL